MVIMLTEDYLKKKRIVFYDQFFTTEQEYSAIDDVKGECINQLRKFNQKRVMNKNKDGTVSCEIFYSGKYGGGNDDFVLSLLIGIYNHKKFWNNSKYRMYWK